MTQPAPYTITTHWHPGKHTDLDEPATETAPDWPTARTKALKLTTLRSTAAVVVRDADGEVIANWDAYSNLWREPRPKPKFIDTLVDIARARLLATDYQANPTRARAHNAAQVLHQVLGALDAIVARTFAITDENDRLKAVAAEHTQCAVRLGESWAYGDKLEAERDRLTPPKLCPGFPVAEPHYARLACFLPEGHPGDHDNQPPTGPGFPIVTSPVEWCMADGWHASSNFLACFLARGHEGDHSTNAHPNPRTWPQVATGPGYPIMVTTDDTEAKRAFLRLAANRNRDALNGPGDA